MSDETTQVVADLFDSNDSDVTTENGNDTQKNEQSEQTKEIDNTAKAQDGEIQRQKQIDAWAKKIKSGDATLDDIPANVAKWAKPLIEEKLTPKEKVADVDIDSLIEKKFAEKEDERNFQILKDQLSKLKLDASQQKELTQEFSELFKAGLPKAKALEKAIKLSGINSKTMDDEVLQLKQSMAIPRNSNVKSKEQYGEMTYDDLKSLHPSSRDRIKFLEDMANSGR